jgi:hypothetical protein
MFPVVIQATIMGQATTMAGHIGGPVRDHCLYRYLYQDLTLISPNVASVDFLGKRSKARMVNFGEQEPAIGAEFQIAAQRIVAEQRPF